MRQPAVSQSVTAAGNKRDGCAGERRKDIPINAMHHPDSQFDFRSRQTFVLVFLYADLPSLTCLSLFLSYSLYISLSLFISLSLSLSLLLLLLLLLHVIASKLSLLLFLLLAGWWLAGSFRILIMCRLMTRDFRKYPSAAAG
jgi:hypothetical protein